MANGAHPGPTIIQWLVDTRPLWPVPKRAHPREEVAELNSVASRALAVLTPSEREAVLKYYHIADAKTSLVSQLLKHYFITRYCGVPWSKSKVSRSEHGKPCYRPEGDDASSQPLVDFNVSHQAGVVSLVGSVGFKGRVDVGTDVVCVDERLARDNEFIEKRSFFEWVDMHADVFSDSEVHEMKLAPVSIPLDSDRYELRGFAEEVISCCDSRNRHLQLAVLNLETGHTEEIMVDSNIIIDAKLRRFYAYWCLREAYVKMTGEALLAPWLKDLIFRGVIPPAPRPTSEHLNDLLQGQILKEFNIIFQGKKMSEAKIELAALGSNYMAGIAVRAELEEDKENLVFGSWEGLDVEDIIVLAES